MIYAYKYNGFVVKVDKTLNNQRVLNIGNVAELLVKKPDDNVILSYLSDGFRLINVPKWSRYNVYICVGDDKSMSNRNVDASDIAGCDIYGDAVFVRRTI